MTSLDIPYSDVNFTEDVALPHGPWAWYPRMGERLGLHRLVQRPGDHEVCYTNPAALVDAVIEGTRA